jgi:hypothetical protein
MAPRLLGSPPFGSWAFVIWPTLANKGHESDGKTSTHGRTARRSLESPKSYGSRIRYSHNGHRSRVHSRSEPHGPPYSTGCVAGPG